LSGSIIFLRVVRATVSKGVKRDYVRMVEAYRDAAGKTQHRTVINRGRRDLWRGISISTSCAVSCMAMRSRLTASSARMWEEHKPADSSATDVGDTPRPTLTLPDKPSVAVLPFNNLNGDPDQDYVSDGITEDIITELSRFSELFVIARNSSFRYKGKAVDIRQIGRELGVRYVLEGSIRRQGDRIRIAAQLVDALAATHHWAERYDRQLDDIYGAVHVWLAATYARLGQMEDATAEAAKVLQLDPDFTIDRTARSTIAFKYTDDGEHCFDAMLRAGLPER
jgi:TolB-like protein